MRSAWHLAGLSARRQVWAWQTFIALGLVIMVAALVGMQSLRYWIRYERLGWQLAPFAEEMIGGVYISFLLPILCLCFGTHAIGGDWEEGSLVWLLVRPIPRPVLYAAKFAAVLPLALAFTTGGLFLMGLAGGPRGLEAAALFWPAVFWGTLAYLSLFVLMGATFRRSTITAVAYSFVIETLIGNMPGLLKRASIGFYSRCIMYGEGVAGVAPDKQSMFMPVEGDTARLVLALLTAGFFFLGMILFVRRERHE
jgi:ABC-2 type transport system permease protein